MHRARRLRFWSGAAVAAGLLITLAGCGSSSGSKRVPGAGGGSGGEGDGTGNTSAEAGRPSTDPGDFGSIWRRDNAEILSIDSENPSGLPTSTQFDFEKKATVAQYGADVEVFEQIADDQLIVYAHYDESEVYFRLALPLTAIDDGFYRYATDGSMASYSIEDGALKLMQTQGSGTLVLITTTYYVKYTGDFPPPDWPSQVVDITPAVLP